MDNTINFNIKKTPINLVNETDLTDWIKEKTWDEKDNQPVSSSDFKNRILVSEKIKSISQMMVHSYIKKNIRTYLYKYMNEEFLSPIKYNENLSDSIKESMKLGSKVYKFNKDKVPEKLKTEIIRLNNFLYDHSLNYIKNQLKQENFSLDIRQLEKDFTTFGSAVAKSKWAKANLNINKSLNFINLASIKKVNTNY